MNRRIVPLIAVLGLALIPAAQASQITPTPRAVAVAITATNRPFLGAATAVQPVGLAARGYVEEEYFVSGNANIYAWAEPGARPAVTVRTPHLPYTTRILVRRPTSPQKASGRVIVELLDPSGKHDAAPLWGLSWEHFLRHGDVWVGVTIKPVAAAALQRFDALRYAPLGFAYRQADDCRSDLPQSEDGLAWDIIAQVGALLRSSSKENPLAGFDVRRLVMAGYAEAGGYLVTYLNALHAELRLGNDAPLFDAYLQAAGAMVNVPINQCAAPLAATDVRRRIGRRDAPVVTVMTQTDFTQALDLRRPDNDEREDFYRQYEIAGAAQAGPFPAGQPAAADLAIAGLGAAAATCPEAQGSFMAGPAFNAVWAQLDEYLLHGLPMAHAEPISVDPQGQPTTDASGNVVGGLRLPAISVPLAVYRARSEPQCSLAGSVQPLDNGQLKAAYGNRTGYLKRHAEAVEAALTQRWLEPVDAAALKAQAARTAPVF
jgi:hypothetical protein